MPFPLTVDLVLSELSTVTPPSWVTLHGMAHSFIESCKSLSHNKVVIHEGIQVYAPTTDAKETEVDQFYEDLQGLLELTPKKRCHFHQRRLECKSRKSRIPGVTGKFGFGVQNEAGQRLT